MIGRETDASGYELTAWARQQAGERGLTATDAHLLLVLATYANREAIAWPSITTLAADCRRSTSAIHRALRRLEDEQLIWTTQGGNGRTARRELLYQPSHQRQGWTPDSPRTSARADPAQPSHERQGSGDSPRTSDTPSPRTSDTQNYQRNKPGIEQARSSPPKNGRAASRSQPGPRRLSTQAIKGAP